MMAIVLEDRITNEIKKYKKICNELFDYAYVLDCNKYKVSIDLNSVKAVKVCDRDRTIEVDLYIQDPIDFEDNKQIFAKFKYTYKLNNNSDTLILERVVEGSINDNIVSQIENDFSRVKIIIE